METARGRRPPICRLTLRKKETVLTKNVSRIAKKPFTKASTRADATCPYEIKSKFYYLTAFLMDRLSVINVWAILMHLQMGKFTLIKIGSHAVCIATMILCAIQWEYVWIILVAGLLSTPLQTIYSYLFFERPKKRLKKSSVKRHDFSHVGKWVFFNSLTTFLVSRHDILLMALYLSKKEFGLYALASAFIYMFADALASASCQALGSLYASLKKYTKEAVRRKIVLLRLALFVLILPPILAISLYAQYTISLISPQYYDLGWILQILALAGVLNSFRAMFDPLLNSNLGFVKVKV
jgi:O-antigen/teichoic acid export membrane protein